MAEEKPVSQKPPKPSEPDEAEPIKLEEGPISLEEGASRAAAGVRTFGVAGGAHGAMAHEYKRELNLTGQGATRCRLFHSRIAVAPLENMQNQINHWLDDEGIEVKQVCQTIGVMEGKTPEPNIIVLVWY